MRTRHNRLSKGPCVERVVQACSVQLPRAAAALGLASRASRVAGATLSTCGGRAVGESRLHHDGKLTVVDEARMVGVHLSDQFLDVDRQSKLFHDPAELVC